MVYNKKLLFMFVLKNDGGEVVFYCFFSLSILKKGWGTKNEKTVYNRSGLHEIWKRND